MAKESDKPADAAGNVEGFNRSANRKELYSRLMLTSDHEYDVLLKTLQNRYDYDFTDYAKASLKRRLSQFCSSQGILSIPELRNKLVDNQELFEYFIQNLTVNVTEMFRDPTYYKQLRSDVINRLATYPFIKIWVAGCSTGEEVYSLAILLEECNLLHKSVIYATDINQRSLQKAREGIYSSKYMKMYTSNYIKSGGERSFSNYYKAKYNVVLINKELKQNIVFSAHNLVTDKSFNEFQLISCRNVLIYFNRKLQNQTINLLYDSLCPFGIICLGSKESMHFSDKIDAFQPLNKKERIFIKVK